MPSHILAPAVDDHHEEVSTLPVKELTPEQLKKAAERKARMEKKAADKKAKLIEKDRRASELDSIREQKEKIAEERRLEKELLRTRDPKEAEAQRREEEAKLFAEELVANQTTAVTHTKKSIVQSNRLGGSHMA